MRYFRIKVFYNTIIDNDHKFLYVQDTCSVSLSVVLNLGQQFIMGLRKYSKNDLVNYVLKVSVTF